MGNNIFTEKRDPTNRNRRIQGSSAFAKGTGFGIAVGVGLGVYFFDSWIIGLVIGAVIAIIAVTGFFWLRNRFGI